LPLSAAFETIQSESGPGQCGASAKVVKPNSQWNLGVTSDFDKSFLSTDQSPPACYDVSGFVAAGFCGVRRKTTKFNDEELGKEFDGKYQVSRCFLCLVVGQPVDRSASQLIGCIQSFDFRFRV
jgi:hypothetical protein